MQHVNKEFILRFSQVHKSDTFILKAGDILVDFNSSSSFDMP